MNKKSGEFKIAHYREKCIGCGMCSYFCPSTWEISKQDGKADLKNALDKNGVKVANTPLSELDDNKAASDSCPVNIIKVYD